MSRIAEIERSEAAPDIPTDPKELARCLADPMWRLSHLYKILIKGDDDDEDGTVIHFKPNRAQRRFISRLWHRNLILKARQLGFCLDPTMRVLTADLRWIAIADLKEGDEVVSVDEHAPGGKGQARRMRTATVQAMVKVQRKAYRITFDDGRSVVCTGQHPWLSRKAGTESKWRALEPREGLEGRLKIGTLVRWVAKPWNEPTHEDGWMGGMLDGEGSIAKSNSSAGINVSQRAGAVWDRLVRYAKDRGYSACVESDLPDRKNKHGKVPVPKLAFGRMDEMFRLIGQTRPTRFIGNRFWEGRELPGKRNGDVGWARITSIEELGEQTMVDLQTSTGTYIAEGFVSHNTTLICILWLDHALFTPNQRCGVVAQDLPTAKSIFRDKVRFAYDQMPAQVKAACPFITCTADEILFANNSSIRVATSMRGGTLHRLLVSEYGKICAKFPEKAIEVQTGSLPAVPLTGIAVIESTAEGQDGDFYKKTQKSMALFEKGKTLNAKDFRFHFYAWWQEPRYRLDPDTVVITSEHEEYIEATEATIGRKLDRTQWAWYVATLEGEFSGNEEVMWREYPSYPEEAFKVSTEGTYYAKQLQRARRERRIGIVPHMPGYPVHTFWDLGLNDVEAIWFMQAIGAQFRFINYYENSGEGPSHYVEHMQKLGYVYGGCYLPHDGAARRVTLDKPETYEDMLRKLSVKNIHIVPRISHITTGIDITREIFPGCWFDEKRCAVGLRHLQNYKKEWNTHLGTWSDHPRHDEASNGADAFRQFAQGYKPPAKRSGKRKSDWRTA